MVRYRDVQYILPVAIQFLLFASPVAYTLASVPESAQTLYELNPLTGLLEGMRWSLIGTERPRHLGVGLRRGRLPGRAGRSARSSSPGWSGSSPMSSDVAIRVEGLGKAYTIKHQQSDHVTLAQVALEKAKHPFRRSTREDFWALKDVSFEVKQGEVLGVIGRNGAGKSTLLKLLTRITGPTTGRIDLWGRVGSLLEVGTGFHPELTGRENVYLNGSILGMSRKEIDRQFDAIVDFAGVEKFLDTPVKRYSSGMYVRLAFAVAAHLETEILLLDEVLAVGDADFQKKCLSKVHDLASGGRSVILVSHSMASVTSFTDQAALLAGGALRAIGPTSSVVAAYLDQELGVREVVDVEHQARIDARLGQRARILSVRLNHPNGIVPPDDDLRFTVVVRSHEALDPVAVQPSIHVPDGTVVGTSFSADTVTLDPSGETTIDLAIPQAMLSPGPYYLGVNIGFGYSPGEEIQHLDIVLDTVHFEVGPLIDSSGIVARWGPGWGPVRLPRPVVLSASCARQVANTSTLQEDR